MLLCRGCGTRFESGQEACPSCGRRAKLHAVDAGASDSGLPPAAGPPADEDSIEAPAPREPDLLELDEPPTTPGEPEIEDPTPIPAPIPTPGRASKKAAVEPTPARIPAPAPPARKAPVPAPAPVVARRRRAEAAAPLALDTAQVRALICERPGLIEKGLGVHADASGKPVGVDFETPVGAIDLLARDLRGGYVVLMVIEPEDDEDLVPGLLRRMGWVRKHLCAAGESVRAVAVVNELPESAQYAAAGLTDGALRFVGYRISLEFHELS